MFANLKKFDRSHDGLIMKAYVDIIMCVNMKMWYNLDTNERVPQRVFDLMLENGDFKQYSKNPEHPVFGEDVASYESGLGKDIIAFASDLDVLVSGLVFTIEQLEDGEKEFARVMSERTPMLLLALSVHPQFGPTLKRSFWEELITFEAEQNGEEISIPVVLHIDRWYLSLRLSDVPEYEEVVRDSMRELEMKGLVIQIASEQRLGQPTTVVLRKSNISHSYVVSLGRDVGYEVEE